MMSVQNPQEVYFGQIINSGACVCRHRALLTKILGDEIGLKQDLLVVNIMSEGMPGMKFY